MSLTESESYEIDKYLTEKGKREIEQIIGELWSIYLFIEKSGLSAVILMNPS